MVISAKGTRVEINAVATGISMAKEMRVVDYLNRIGYRGSRYPTFPVLRRLHRSHMLSVPFENIDIHRGTPIVLDQKLLYSKIVGGGRGGYCYELNCCFAWLLKKLGFRVSMLSARVASKSGVFSPEFDHMTLLVGLEERWLVDVGFGDSFTEPKQIDNVDAQKDDRYFYKITSRKERLLLSRRPEMDGSWEARYSFTLRPRKLGEFVARNRWQQTSSRSHFTRGRLISQLTPSGRVTLTDQKLILTRNGRRIERPVKNSEEFDRFLSRYFRLGFPKS